jgi:hypothetical protein
MFVFFSDGLINNAPIFGPDIKIFWGQSSNCLVIRLAPDGSGYTLSCYLASALVNFSYTYCHTTL